ncbi:hypothetical protein MHYP_G00271980 [Metynnis hypsauchen]
MDWRPVQGVSCLSPNDSWDRLQHPPATLTEKWLRKWMDGCFPGVHPFGALLIEVCPTAWIKVQVLRAVQLRNMKSVDRGTQGCNRVYPHRIRRAQPLSRLSLCDVPASQAFMWSRGRVDCLAF